MNKRDEEYNRYGYRENPNAKWDWCVLGGRWKGFFKVKLGASSGVLGESGTFGNTADLNTADKIRKGDVDFDLMRQEIFEKVSKNWDEWNDLFNIDKERAIQESYWSYGVQNIGEKDNFVPEDRTSYLKRQGDLSTFAIIKDGKWYEKGSMGWWVMVSDEKTSDEWSEQFNKLLNDLPDDMLLSVYDCHI